MVAAAKASVPTIQDQASAMQLSQCAKNLGTALAELRTAAQKVKRPFQPWDSRCRTPTPGVGGTSDRPKAQEYSRNFCCSLPQAQEACGPLEMDSALSVVQNLEKDLQEIKAAARDGKLKPLPGETVSSPNNMPAFKPRQSPQNLY